MQKHGCLLLLGMTIAAYCQEGQEMILAEPTEFIAWLDSCDPNRAEIEAFLSIRYPNHTVAIADCPVQRNNDPNRHLDYYHQTAWDVYCGQIERGLPALLYVAEAMSWVGNKWVPGCGLGWDYVESRNPPLMRYAFVWHNGALKKIYFRGACGTRQAPHPCWLGIELIVTWELQPMYFVDFFRWWLRECEWPGWCHHADANYDGIVDLIDYARFAAQAGPSRR